MKKRVTIGAALCLLIVLLLPVCYNAYKSEVLPSSGRPKTGFFKRLFGSGKAEKHLLKPAEYMAYCEEESNGLKSSRTIGDFVFSVFYQPVPYLALKELKSTTPDKAAMASKQEEYGPMSYFAFKIENTRWRDELMKLNLKSENEYYARLEYMSFKMQQDFKLIQGSDTLACSLFHFERVYGLAPFATFVMAFPTPAANREFKLWYHDKLFNNGIIMMDFESGFINQLPTLDI